MDGKINKSSGVVRGWDVLPWVPLGLAVLGDSKWQVVALGGTRWGWQGFTRNMHESQAALETMPVAWKR